METPPDPEPALTPPAPPALPRLWPTLAMALGIIPALIVIGGTAVVLGMWIDGAFGRAQDPDQLAEWMVEFGTTPLGFGLLFVVPEVSYLLAAFGPALLSPVPFARRLGFVRGRLPWWSYPILVVATPICSVVALVLLAPFPDELSGQLEFLVGVFSETQGLMAVVLVLFLSVAPGVAEESFFRGYVQRRLLQRWHPLAAIAFTSVLFAAAHIDPQHAVAVLPLGIWLGIVAWRAGSIWPAVICHACTNLFGILGARFGDPEAAVSLSFETVDFVVLGVVTLAFLASVFILIRFGRTPAERQDA